MLALQQRPAAPAALRHRSPAAAPFRASRRAPRPARRAAPQPPAAFFQTLFKRPSQGDSGSGGLAEKPLYKPSEMVNMGPFKVSPMGFGTWSWGNKLLWGYDEQRDPELQDVFNLVVRSGINLFDTADSYGTGKLNGRSEQLLGQFLSEYPGSSATRDSVRIATKLAAYPWRLTPKQWVGACRETLKRMGQDRIALAQLHWSTANYAPLQERLMWDGLVAIYEEGLVDAVGLSNYGPRQLAKIGQYLDKRGVPLAAVQVQYSLLSRGPEQAAVKAACDDLGVALISYSPLALGMLTGKYSMDDPSSLPGGPRGFLFKQVLPGLQPLLQVMGEIAARRRKTMSQVAINWCMCQGTVPIPGAKDLAQAKENLGALGWRLSDGEVRALNEAADRVPRGMQQNVFQTR
ncbi:pyridoxal chloroplastic [Micractinium conductrix]|uniref:Pyridoxal chloroplastic n=1 Tax=Micractinium conductrix TaxID=554055 RepID=A0A2P6VIJ2_9CHLO|nr:pyridoxal chloroplastic [Micractinium conductrix]|eukprot:PSC73909.1 pyridoxal chloroplastic [Micractinium conductrix]